MSNNGQIKNVRVKMKIVYRIRHPEPGRIVTGKITKRGVNPDPSCTRLPVIHIRCTYTKSRLVYSGTVLIVFRAENESKITNPSQPRMLSNALFDIRTRLYVNIEFYTNNIIRLIFVGTGRYVVDCYRCLRVIFFVRDGFLFVFFAKKINRTINMDCIRTVRTWDDWNKYWKRDSDKRRIPTRYIVSNLNILYLIYANTVRTKYDVLFCFTRSKHKSYNWLYDIRSPTRRWFFFLFFLLFIIINGVTNIVFKF